MHNLEEIFGREWGELGCVGLVEKASTGPRVGELGWED